MKRKIATLLSVFLCFALLLSTAGAAAGSTAEPETTDPAAEATEAPAEESTGTNGAEEVIYGRLDASGKPQSAYAVVALTLDEDGEITHYGRYTEVENLTDTSPIEYANGRVTLTAGEGRYYYQGTLRSAELPWDIEITYTLNGAAISPDELGGRSGELEVSIHTAANSGYDAYFTESFMLQISVSLDADLCSNISARNGTVASAGSDKQITFVVLPGGEGDVGFTADVTDFAMGGFTIAAVPYSMSSMVGDMEELDTVTDGVTQITDAISRLASAAATLRNGANELSGSSSELTGASDQIAAALNEMSAGLQSFDVNSMVPDVDLSAMSQLTSGLTEIAYNLNTISTYLRSAAGSVAGLQALMGSLSGLMAAYEQGLTVDPSLADTDPLYGAMSQAIGSMTSAGLDDNAIAGLMGLSSFADGIDECVNGIMSIVNQLGSASDSMGDATGEIDTSAITQLQSGMAELAANYAAFNEGLKTYTDGVGQISSGMSSYTNGIYSLNNETKEIPGMIDELLGAGEDENTEDTGPVSFLDERNTDTASVQFVISTDGVSAPEAPAEEEPAAESRGFFADLWDKIVSLFT